MPELLPLVKIAEGYLEACEEMGIEAEELVKLGQQPTTAQMSKMMRETGSYSPAKWQAKQKKYQTGVARQEKRLFGPGFGKTPLTTLTPSMAGPAAPAAPAWTPAELALKASPGFSQTGAGAAPPSLWTPAQLAKRRGRRQARVQSERTEAEAMKTYGAGLRSGAISAEAQEPHSELLARAGTPAEKALAQKKEQFRQRFVALQQGKGKRYPISGAGAGGYVTSPKQQEIEAHYAKLDKDFPPKNEAEAKVRQMKKNLAIATGELGEAYGAPVKAVKGWYRGLTRGLKSREQLAAEDKAKADEAKAEATATTDEAKAKGLEEKYQETLKAYRSKRPGAVATEQAVAAGRLPPPEPATRKGELVEMRTYMAWLKNIRPRMLPEDKGDPGATARRLGWEGAIPNVWRRHEWQRKYGRGGYQTGAYRGPVRRVRALRRFQRAPGMVTWS